MRFVEEVEETGDKGGGEEKQWLMIQAQAI